MKPKNLIITLVTCLLCVASGPVSAFGSDGGILAPKERSVFYASPGTTVCSDFESRLSVMAIPCNGISVTSVTFNASGRTIESGTNNTVGVVYRYPNVGVAPDGTFIDALVTVLSYSNNHDSSATTFRNADTPGSTAGFDDNLQPSLEQESNNFISNAPWNGSITYRIQFVDNGTTTPRVITIAATSVDNDGSGACGGLRESVTYSNGFNQILRAAVTNQTIAGNVVTGPTTTQSGIGTGANYSNAALYINITQFDWTFSFSTTGNCTNGGSSEDRYGSLNLACQINFGQNFVSAAVSGTVFNDANGLSDLTVNGIGLGLPSSTQLFANLLDTNGNVVSSVTVNSNGTYSFPTVVSGNYQVQISTVQGVESDPAPATTLPAGWVNTGENLGAGSGSDGTPNGHLPITVASSSLTNANFGIEQRPSAGTSTAPAQVNPGGTNNITVPAATFTASDPSPGTVVSIRIIAFPNEVTTLTINGTPYTAGTFPPGGVVIPADGAGNPLQTVLIDPFDGNRTITINFVSIDAAGYESLGFGSAIQPVSAGTTAADVSVSGRVLDDQGRGAPRAFITIVGPDGSARTAITNPFGYFYMDALEVNTLYVIRVSHKRFRYEPRSITLVEELTGLDFVPEP